MSRFKNNAEVAQHYTKIDTNPDDYKVSNPHPYHPHTEDSYEEGVSIHFVDGSVYRSRQLTCQEVDQAINFSHKKWLQLGNFGGINVANITHFEPHRFYDHPQSSHRSRYDKR